MEVAHAPAPMRDGPRSRRRGETNRAGQTSPRPPREPSSRAVIKRLGGSEKSTKGEKFKRRASLLRGCTSLTIRPVKGASARRERAQRAARARSARARARARPVKSARRSRRPESHRNRPLGQPGAGARRTAAGARRTVGECCPQPKRGKNNCGMAGRGRGMAGRGRGTALGPDERDNIRVQLDVLRATARNSKFRPHTRLRLLASTQAGQARGAKSHPPVARRGERGGPGPHRAGRPGAAGDRPASRGHRGRVAGSERELRARGACTRAPHFARNGACDGAGAGARNGARNGAGRCCRGTSGGDPDGPAGPRPRPVPRPLAIPRAPGPTAPARLDTRAARAARDGDAEGARRGF